MALCTVRWRPSGGRGEFEYVPTNSIPDRAISVRFGALGITIPSEVYATKVQGKPRLRKLDSNNRQKLHLPQLVMAVARLPQPAREDLTHAVAFPLEDRAFVLSEITFDILSDDGKTVVLEPLAVSILHSSVVIDLQERFARIAADLADIAAITKDDAALGQAVADHWAAVSAGVNWISLRETADRVIARQATVFGKTNAGSIRVLEAIDKLPPVDIEAEITGKEGRLLTRLHVYRERDPNFVKKAKSLFKSTHGGKLVCELCGLDPEVRYSKHGDRAIEAHHKTPIEELLPDSITKPEDLAMVCASCHRIIHAQRPCLTLDEAKALIKTAP